MRSERLGLRYNKWGRWWYCRAVGSPWTADPRPWRSLGKLQPTARWARNYPTWTSRQPSCLEAPKADPTKLQSLSNYIPSWFSSRFDRRFSLLSPPYFWDFWSERRDDDDPLPMVGRIEIRKWMQADLACSGLLSSASANRRDIVGQFLSQYYKAGTDRTEMQLVTGYLHSAHCCTAGLPKSQSKTGTDSVTLLLLCCDWNYSAWLKRRLWLAVCLA